MAGVAIGITTNGVIVGFNSAMASFVPQSFGRGDLHSCGVYLSRARLVIFLIQILTSFALLMIEPFYSSLGINKETAQFSSQYIHMVIPGLFF